MSDTPIMATIAIFPYNRVPRGWAWCDGSLLPVAQNQALFSLLGVTYGGNGTTTFGLPNLNGRVPVGAGQGPGLSYVPAGAVAGVEIVTLTSSQMPAHAHPLGSSTAAATSASPVGAVPASSEAMLYHASGEVEVALPGAGSNQPHNNMQPYLVLGYAIALVGIYPSRN